MKSIAEILRLGRTLRVLGFDDAPFGGDPPGQPVHLAGIVCADTRFEGMLWGELERDGLDATDAVLEMVLGSKFHDQVHLVLTDGLAFGGFNLLDLPRLSAELDRPVAAVMRRPPDMDAIAAALEHLDRTTERLALIERAGPIHAHPPFFFQVAGASPDDLGAALERLTDQGHVPEALRLAHIIGAAIKTGVSSQRA